MSLATEIAGKLNYLNDQDKNMVNALAPFSGYMNWKEDNFVFNTSTSFLASIADKNRYVKFGDKVVDTYGPELITNGDFSTSTITYIPPVSIRGTAVIENGRLKITRSGTDTGGNVYIGYSGFDASKVYELKISWDIGTASGIKIYNDSNGYMSSKSGSTVLYITGKTILNIALDEISQTNHYCYFDNISVREIQSKSAIDLIPDVTVLDQATNGLTTQSSVNAGDYVVVDRKELITNGTFDTDTSGWTNDRVQNLSITSGVVHIESNGTGSGFLSQYISSGKSIVKIVVSDIGSGGTLRNYYNTTNYTYYNLVTGTNIIIIPSTTRVLLETLGSNAGAYFNVDSISIIQLDEVYRAKIDAPSGTLLTNTTYFEVRDNLPISNQIAFLHTIDATTKAYEGITNEILFNDALATETPKAIMLKNGFSEVSKGLYSKGSKWYVFAGYWQTLNKGAYHPVFNIAGTRPFKAVTTGYALYWYGRDTAQLSGTLPLLNGVNSCFIATNLRLDIGDVLHSTSYNWRPDSKYYDIIYQDQFISFESSELAYKPNSDEKKRIREYEKFRGVSDLTVTEQKLQTTTGSVATLEVNDGTKYLVGDYVQIWTGTTAYRRRVVSISSNTLTLDSAITKTAVNFIISCQRYAYNSKGTSLTTDLIGDPDFYIPIIKNRLNEGKVLFGINPLLVGQDNISYINQSVVTITVSKKTISNNASFFSINNGTSWSVNSVNSVGVLNSTILRTSDYDATGYHRQNIVQYTSQNNPYQTTTPKAVASVDPKVIASNSHSIYKGAIVGNCIGKVQVGNGTNGFESKVLDSAIVEKAHIYKSMNISWSGINGNWNGAVLHLDVIGNETDAYGGLGYYIYTGSYTGTVSNITTTKLTLTKANDWLYLGIAGGAIVTTPQHSTIALDNANSPASKWFEGTCYDDDYEYPFVVIQGVDAVNRGDTGNFGNLTNGTVTDWNGNTQTTKFMIGTPIARRD